MSEKLLFKLVAGWVGILVLVNIFYVPYLVFTTPGEEQKPMTFIGYSIIAAIVGCGLIFIVPIIINLIKKFF